MRTTKTKALLLGALLTGFAGALMVGCPKGDSVSVTVDCNEKYQECEVACGSLGVNTFQCNITTGLTQCVCGTVPIGIPQAI